MKLFSFVLHCAVVFAQFIDAPTAFDTAELYVPPSGTSVYTFGNSEASAATGFLLTPSDTFTVTSPPVQTTQTTGIETISIVSSTEIPPISSSSELETSTRSSQAIPGISGVETPPPFSSSKEPEASTMSSQAVIETVSETHYTTVPCITKSAASIELSQQSTASSSTVPSDLSPKCLVTPRTRSMTTTTQVTSIIESTIFVTQYSTLTQSA